MRKKSFAALLLAMLSLPCMPVANGQTAVQITTTSGTEKEVTIEELFEWAEQNSQSLKVQRAGIEQARHGLSAAKAERLPEISSSLSLGYLADGLLSDRDFKGWTHVDNPHFTNNFALKARQVVYAGGAVDGNIKLASIRKEQADIGLQMGRQEIRFLLVGYYLELCKLQNQQRVIEKNLELTNQVIKNMNVRHKEGTALRNDITRYELQREQLLLQLEKVKNARETMNHHIVITLHLPEGTHLKGNSELLVATTNLPVEAEWQALSKKTNLSLQQKALEVKSGKQQLKLERSALLPKVSIVAENHFDGPITIEVPVINKNFNYWFAGVGIQYDLSALYKSNHKVRRAKQALRQAEEQQKLEEERVNNAVQATYMDYQTATAERRAQKKSVELADQSYDVTANRYRNGLALLTDMLDASNSKLSADLGLVNAEIDVLYNYYKLKYVTHTL